MTQVETAAVEPSTPPYRGSRIFAEALRSVEEPITNFIETGIYSHGFMSEDLPEDVMFSSGLMGESQVRRACRNVAKELKRPFIIMSPYVERYGWVASTVQGNMQARVPVTPTFKLAHIVIPRQKRLSEMVHMLLLLSPLVSGEQHQKTN